MDCFVKMYVGPTCRVKKCNVDVFFYCRAGQYKEPFGRLNKAAMRASKCRLLMAI